MAGAFAVEILEAPASCPTAFADSASMQRGLAEVQARGVRRERCRTGGPGRTRATTESEAQKRSRGRCRLVVEGRRYDLTDEIAGLTRAPRFRFDLTTP